MLTISRLNRITALNLKCNYNTKDDNNFKNTRTMRFNRELFIVVSICMIIHDIHLTQGFSCWDNREFNMVHVKMMKPDSR